MPMPNKSIQDLREAQQEKHRLANKLLAEKGSQTWTADDKKQFDSLMDESERLQDQVDAHQRLLDNEAENAAPRRQGKPEKMTDAQKGFDIYLRKSTGQMSAEEAVIVRNTMSTTTGSEGGYTVQTTVASELIQTLKSYGAMRLVSRSMSTASGGPLSYPTMDATADEGEIIAENGSATDSDPTFGTRSLNTVKFSSKVIAVPIEVLKDSTIDIQSMIFDLVRQRIGRHLDRKLTLGSGTGEPTGIITASSVGKVGASGQTATILYADLVDLLESLDVAYTSDAANPARWMMAQSMRKVVRKLVDGNNRPIWTPSYDAGLTGTKTDLLLDCPVAVNNFVAAPAASAKSLAFGRFDRYMIRDALDVTIQRFDDSAFARKGQVGFLAWSRHGGNLLDVNAVKVYQQAAS